MATSSLLLVGAATGLYASQNGGDKSTPIINTHSLPSTTLPNASDSQNFSASAIKAPDAASPDDMPQSSTGVPTSDSNTTNPDVHITINGQAVAVPQNGTTQQTINDSNGNTTIHVSANSSTSSDVNGSSSTSTNLQLQTETQSQNSTESGP